MKIIIAGILLSMLAACASTSESTGTPVWRIGKDGHLYYCKTDTEKALCSKAPPELLYIVIMNSMESA